MALLTAQIPKVLKLLDTCPSGRRAHGQSSHMGLPFWACTIQVDGAIGFLSLATMVSIVCMTAGLTMQPQ